GRPVLEEVAEARVRLLGGAETGVLPHGPETPPVHRRLDAAREGVLPRDAQLSLVVERGRVGAGVEPLPRDVRGGAALGPPLRRARARLVAPARVGLGVVRLAYRHGGQSTTLLVH